MGQARETSPLFAKFLGVLEAGGACTEVGWSVKQDELASAVGVSYATIYRYVKRMKELGIVRVHSTTVDRVWGAPRAPDRYFLSMTLEQWQGEAGDELIAGRHLRVSNRRSATARNREREKKRRERGREPRPVPEPAPVDEAAVAELAASFGGDDLFGW